MKKFLALALAALVFLLAGCENQQTVNSDNSVTGVTNAQDLSENSDNSSDDENVELDENANSTVDMPVHDTSPDNESETEASNNGLTQMYLSYSAEYNADGNLSVFTVYEYDELGNKIRETTSSHTSNFTDTQTFEYNSNNLVVKASVYSGDILKEHIELDYDDNGNITSYRTYNPNGTVNYGKYISNYDAEYDSLGRQTKRTRYESKDSYTVTTTEYNEAGLVLREKCVTSGGKLLTLITYEYDDKNRRTRWTEQNTKNPEYDHDITQTYIENPDGTYSATTTYTGTTTVIGFEVYDEHGNIIQQHTYLDDELYNMHFTTYNENEDITYFKTLNANNEIVSETTVEYDSNGEISHSYKVNYSESNGEETEETTVIYSQTPESDGYYKKELTIDTLNGEYFGETARYFDKAGNLVKTTTVALTTDIEIIYKYDNDGNLLETSHYSNGILVYRVANEYICIEGAWHDVFPMN